MRKRESMCGKIYIGDFFKTEREIQRALRKEGEKELVERQKIMKTGRRGRKCQGKGGEKKM